jgi:hypothetical protein
MYVCRRVLSSEAEEDLQASGRSPRYRPFLFRFLLVIRRKRQYAFRSIERPVIPPRARCLEASVWISG